jgi:hypothetical protein
MVEMRRCRLRLKEAGVNGIDRKISPTSRVPDAAHNKVVRCRALVLCGGDVGY